MAPLNTGDYLSQKLSEQTSPEGRPPTRAAHVGISLLLTPVIVVFVFSFYFFSSLNANIEGMYKPARYYSEDKTRPKAFDGCGHWQEEYMELHRKILAGDLPPRYLVSIPVQDGLADRVTGIISEFYFALLTGRAFQITNARQKMPSFQSAFDAPFINWTRHVDDPEILVEHLRYTYKGQRGYIGPRHYPDTGEVDLKEYGSIYIVNFEEPGTRFFARDDLGKVRDDNITTLFMASNRGRVVGLFDNPFHRQQLFEMGLRPDTAFGCAFRFLFAPNNAVKDAFGSEFERLKSSPEENTLNIAINVRVGDYAFDPEQDNQRTTMDGFEGYFRCAEEIEAARRRNSDTKVTWYFTSDSSRLRQLVLEKYGSDKILTRLGHYNHGDCQHKQQSCEEDALASAIITASGQLWAMASADYHVITRNSGFGMQGAWLGNRWHNIFEIERGEERRCGPDDYDTYEDSSKKWSGIR